jgi:chromosomal replication initiator protein
LKLVAKAKEGRRYGGVIMTHEEWEQLKHRLLKTVGQNNYKTWIEPLNFRDLKDGIAAFEVPTNFMGNYVSQNFSDLILYEIKNQNSDIRRLRFMVSTHAKGGLSAVDTSANLEKPESHKTARTTLATAPLDRRFTFNPLFLYGGVGLGKTHLMHAIAWELQKRRPDLNVLYLSAEQFMYRFVQALRDRKMMDFKSIFRSVDVLMVDDVQFIAGKDSTQEEFFHTFNALVDQNKQIIISADRAPGEIKDLEDRVKSRLQCGLVVDLHPTDYELRLGILQSKVEQQQENYPNLNVESGVLEFLAQRISTNVRVLEGALTRLFAFASLVGRPINLELTQDCLADVLRDSERKITVEEIQRRVSEHYNIRLSDMVGPKRLRSYARPRQVAMYLCKHLTSRSLPDIGRRFGGRDHTTVMHGVKRIEELKLQDGQIAEDLELLRRSLEA